MSSSTSVPKAAGKAGASRTAPIVASLVRYGAQPYVIGGLVVANEAANSDADTRALLRLAESFELSVESSSLRSH